MATAYGVWGCTGFLSFWLPRRSGRLLVGRVRWTARVRWPLTSRLRGPTTAESPEASPGHSVFGLFLRILFKCASPPPHLQALWLHPPRSWERQVKSSISICERCLQRKEALWQLPVSPKHPRCKGRPFITRKRLPCCTILGAFYEALGVCCPSSKAISRLPAVQLSSDH